MVGITMDGPARDRVLKLMDEKNRIESEIRDQVTILDINHVGMDEPLVDSEDYPRNDIDVYKVRHARHRIICLRNDLKNIMKMIEQGLAEVHSNFRGSADGETGNLPQPASNGISNGHSSTQSDNGVITDSFAVVGFVDDGSPADLAGLCSNDEILQFGSVNSSNFTDIMQIQSIVSHSVGQRVTIQVKRGHNILNLTLVPRPWAKPGLLGCHIQRRNS